MAAATITELGGLFKTRYAKTFAEVRADITKLIDAIAFSKAEKIGEVYKQPVALTHAHGITYLAPSSGRTALRASVPPVIGTAEVDSYSTVISNEVTYDALSKGLTGDVTYKSTIDYTVTESMNSLAKRLEIAILYGQTGLGKTSSSSNVDTTHTIITLTTATWASQLWGGMEGGCPIQVWSSVGALTSSGADSIFTIDAVSVENRTITVAGTTTGITALDIAIGAGTCDIYFDTARTSASVWREMIGIDKIITNAGTLFGISAATYNMWKGNSYSVGGALTLKKVMDGLALPIAKGLDEKVTLYVNDRTFSGLVSDEAALRTYGASDLSDGKNGFRAIRFYCGATEVEVVPYSLVKEGEAFALPLKKLKRIGSADISFDNPFGDPEVFTKVQGYNTYEYQGWTDQQIYIETPAKCLKYTGIVNA